MARVSRFSLLCIFSRSVKQQYNTYHQLHVVREHAGHHGEIGFPDTSTRRINGDEDRSTGCAQFHKRPGQQLFDVGHLEGVPSVVQNRALRFASEGIGAQQLSLQFLALLTLPRRKNVRPMRTPVGAAVRDTCLTREFNGNGLEQWLAVFGFDVKEFRIVVVLVVGRRDAERHGVVHTHQRHAHDLEQLAGHERRLLQNHNVTCCTT
jgi:hypothetical protein